jgi:hypothetical protein
MVEEWLDEAGRRGKSGGSGEVGVVRMSIGVEGKERGVMLVVGRPQQKQCLNKYAKDSREAFPEA